MSRVDLHLHSLASDGVLSPAEVVRAVAARGLSGLSLTDHDTVAGVEEARAEAERLGLAFLVGAELSANEPGRSVHVLAYGFDPANPELTSFFERFRRDRLRRAEEIVDRLNENGVPLAMDAVLREAPGGLPTRAHLGRALVTENLVPDIHSAFRLWLARDRPAFVEKTPSPPPEVFELIHRAGGVAVLAHPGRDYSEADLDGYVAAGLDGIEILHAANGPSIRASLGRVVRKHGLLRSGGSDWHGPGAGGSEPGSQRVPATWMQEIVEQVAALS
ncbi:MAG: PHP domain-containing protein [marine benthic group bacterium]|nr:PHP domain-containing protein [Gemmatimonadota bacterium]MCL7981192.1 PHP domain-containing protein [Gemmatimonadota bacterium]MCL7990713.1 PHP domain-containing protein [Gemmatimonadota bacterium]